MHTFGIRSRSPQEVHFLPVCSRVEICASGELVWCNRKTIRVGDPCSFRGCWTLLLTVTPSKKRNLVSYKRQQADHPESNSYNINPFLVYPSESYATLLMCTDNAQSLSFLENGCRLQPAFCLRGGVPFPILSCCFFSSGTIWGSAWLRFFSIDGKYSGFIPWIVCCIFYFPTQKNGSAKKKQFQTSRKQQGLFITFIQMLTSHRWLWLTHSSKIRRLFKIQRKQLNCLQYRVQYDWFLPCEPIFGNWHFSRFILIIGFILP